MKGQSNPIHIKSSQNNLLHLNSTDSDYSWLGWSRNESFKITMGINNLDDFYIDRRYNDSWNSNTFVIKRNSGKIGIGTSDPSSNLHIKSNRAELSIENTNSSEWAFIRLKGPEMNFWDIAQYGNNDYLEFRPKGGSPSVIFKQSGNVAIYGKLESKEIKVTLTPTADFVFESDYNLPTLEFIENYIKEKKHLPNIASAKEMEKNGVNIGDFQIQLLQKIEELTLYTIQQQKEIERLRSLEKRLAEIEKLLESKK
ncbi:hypothetical protein L0P88_16270 [Muricauda sp. SCSIO 64092]|uniref:hypothetical protein n=1 Tax=Allomuricauda sp. SCSIO 64092 TaxID=2908842 RepID=UPI001FF139C1|nr:hypothetical protein [Muricauda sp. SCSIO 64092]UOY05500.1 hypothetical protein L0P88_16270 [Muricauda sp. SCSIO 64092]